MNWTFVIADSDDLERNATIAAIKRFSPAALTLPAASGAATLNVLEERRTVPSLILIDHNLADMTGVDLLGEIYARRWLDRVPIAYLSHPLTDRLTTQVYRLGVLSVLTKPLSQYELRQAIREFAREARVLEAAAIVSARPVTQRTAA